MFTIRCQELGGGCGGGGGGGGNQYVVDMTGLEY